MSLITKSSHSVLKELRRILWRRLFEPVDIASLVVFRISFGAIMFWEAWRYFQRGWIKRYWIDAGFHFTYFGFDWVRPWPGDWMYRHLWALAALSILIMLGLWYRVAIALFFFGFTYLFLLDQARYLNHLYLVCLMSFLVIFVPAHRAFSIDAWRNPAARSDTAPAWSLWLLRFQIGLVYFYGGLAKLNGDWLRGEPMRMWLKDYIDYPFIGRFVGQEWMVYLFSYGGLLLDLLIAPLLLWRRTRPAAFVVVVSFHLTNAWLFDIGIFPWFAIAATTLFFSPDWPRRLLRRWRVASKDEGKKSAPERTEARPARLRPFQQATMPLLFLYLIIQLIVPLRHYLYPGNVSWTEEGHYFAWHMKLRDKDASALFFVTDPEEDKTWAVDPRDYLPGWQAREMYTDPDMILQFSHHIAREERKKGFKRVEVRASVKASLNGRKHQLLIDPTVDLAAQPRTLLPARWIVPLTEPL